MTDAELRDAAVAELKLTTAGWRKPNGNPNYPSGIAPPSTHWGKAMNLLAQIGQEPPPPVAIPLSAPANLASVQASAPADAVYLLSGTFGDQTFTLNKKVKFLGAAGASLGDVRFECGSGDIELANLKVGVVTIGAKSVAPGGAFGPSASDITLRDLDGTRWSVHWAERIRIIGGDWGLPTVQQSQCTLAPYNPYDAGHVPTDILVDGCYIHDFGMPNPSGQHSDGIQTWGMNGVVIRNCTFQRIGGTGALTMEFLDFNYLPADVKAILNGNHSLYPWFGHVRIYGNKSLDTVKCAPSSGNPYCAYYDVQQSPNIPDYDYAMVTAQNVWPRGVYLEPASAGGGYPASWGAPPVPPIPPNWPPA